MTFSIMTFSIMTFSIMTLGIMGLNVTLCTNNTYQAILKNVMVSVNIILLC